MPGSVDPFETAVRAVLGQQVSVAGARTIAGRIVERRRLRRSPIPDDHLTHVFPSPAELAAIDPALLPMPMRRRATLIDLAKRIALGKIALDAGADRADVRRALLDVPGIGPWTADYVLMRGLGDPDVFLDADLGVKHALSDLGRAPPTPPNGGGRGARTPCTICGKGAQLNHRTTIDSPIGTITLVADDDALVEVHLPDEKSPSTTAAADTAPATIRCWRKRPPSSTSTSPATGWSSTSRWRPHGTAFQLAAWQALRTIPYGETVSYGEQARRLGDRNLPAPWAPPTAATRCRSSSRATASSAPTVTSPASVAASSARPGCSTTNGVRQRYAAGPQIGVLRVESPGTDTPSANTPMSVRCGRGRGRTARGAGRLPPACVAGLEALGLERFALGVVSVGIRSTAGTIWRGSSGGSLTRSSCLSRSRITVARRPRRRRSRRASSA